MGHSNYKEHDINTIEFLNKINDEVKTKITIGNRYITGFMLNYYSKLNYLS